MRTHRIWQILFFLTNFLTPVSPQSPWQNLQQLSGTWKRDGQPRYESWEAASPTTLSGQGFRLDSRGQRQEQEYLSIVLKPDGSIVYQATVPHQNGGATVDFPLTFFTSNSWTFENPEHDFPQKIEYALHGELLSATVSGGERSFTWHFNKVDAPTFLPPTLEGYTVFVADQGSGSIRRFDAFTGAYLGEFGQAPMGGGPQDVAIGPDGLLYVTATTGRQVLKFDPATGEFLGRFTEGYDLQQPVKMHFATDGFLYVSQRGAGQPGVVRFDARTGRFDRTCTGPLNGAAGMALDPEGNLYVACFFTGDVQKFAPDGRFLGAVTPPGALKGPSHLWFDRDGSLLVVDWDVAAVKRFRPEGAGFAFAGDFASGFGRLEGAAQGPDGFLYACDWHLGLVKKLEAATGVEIGVYLQGNGLSKPCGLAFGKF